MPHPPLLDTRTLLRHRPQSGMAIKSNLELGRNAIVYTYPHGEVDIVCAGEKVWIPEGYEEINLTERVAPAKREKGKKSEGDDRLRSCRRARANLRRLALANDFRWFVTLTLDPAKVDRYDPAAIMKIANRWLDNMVRRHGLRYVLVPERHQDGAFHFHGFFAGDVAAVDSGHTANGRPVYNLPEWPLGFTTAQELYGEYSSAVAYVCKYIGKQDGERPMGRWYYSGGKLAAPHKEYVDLDYRELKEEYCGKAVEFTIPGTKMLVIHTKGEDYV